MSVFTWTPSKSAAQSVKPRVLIAQFGDGYEQRSPDGLNNLNVSWSLVFTNRVDVIDQIENFLRARQGSQAFDWTPPRGATGRFVCDAEWKRDMLSPAVDSLSCTFRRVNEP